MAGSSFGVDANCIACQTVTDADRNSSCEVVTRADGLAGACGFAPTHEKAFATNKSLAAKSQTFSGNKSDAIGSCKQSAPRLASAALHKKCSTSSVSEPG